ncbi:MAG: ABC transporter permease, partial [Vulcanimicrobiaceae bacterium]
MNFQTATGLWARFCQNRTALAAAIVLMSIAITAIVGPVLHPGSPFALTGNPFIPPFSTHPLGTDMLGRDEMVGLIYGARTSLAIGLSATLVATIVGVALGALAGFYGGILDNLLMRVTEIFQTIPSFIFAILIVAVLSPSIKSVIFAISIVSWPPMARLVRGEVQSLRARDFTQACILTGLSDLRIIVVHILPNCFSSIVVTGSLMVATAILTESALSFLGLSDPNVMSWGFMVGA